MLVMKIDTSNILQSLLRWFQNSETAVFVSFIFFCGCGSGDSFHLGSAGFSQKNESKKSASNAFFKRVLGSQPTKKI